MRSRSCGDDQVAVVAIKSRLSGGGRRGQQLALAGSLHVGVCVCVCTLAVLKRVVLRCTPRRFDSLYPRIHFVVATLCGCTADAVRHHLWARTPTDDAVAVWLAYLAAESCDGVSIVNREPAFKFLELGTWNLSETWK
jgi:hypothetical protein